jgi:hypothetical protein
MPVLPLITGVIDGKSNARIEAGFHHRYLARQLMYSKRYIKDQPDR